MTQNVIRTGVRFDKPCPDPPNDGWDWIAVNVDDEWRLLRGLKKIELRDDEIAIHEIGGPSEVVRTRR